MLKRVSFDEIKIGSKYCINNKWYECRLGGYVMNDFNLCHPVLCPLDSFCNFGEELSKYRNSIIYEKIEKEFEKELCNFTTKQLVEELSKRQGIRRINIPHEIIARIQIVDFDGQINYNKLNDGAIILEVID